MDVRRRGLLKPHGEVFSLSAFDHVGELLSQGIHTGQARVLAEERQYRLVLVGESAREKGKVPVTAAVAAFGPRSVYGVVGAGSVRPRRTNCRTVCGPRENPRA